MTPAVVALTRAGVAFQVHEYQHDPSVRSYGEEAAGALGVAPERVFKTLLVEADGRLAVGIVPVARERVREEGEDVLAPAREALARGDIMVVFPEGTRGDASDDMGRLKNGVARLAEACPDAPVIPVWIEGAGRVLPKGGMIPVPMNCCVLVGEPIRWKGRRTAFMDSLKAALLELKAQAPPLRWS